MRVVENVSKKLIRLTHGLVNTFVLTIILLLLAFSCYAIWDSGQVYAAASAAHYQKFNPTVETEGASFQSLQAINPDVFAWLTVYGTNIDYPMVQGADNIRYVNTSAEGRHSLSGAIFMDYRSAPGFTDFSSLVYGHHMESATMFGEVGLFSQKDYFDARPYGMLYFDGREHGLEFFAFVHADAYDHNIFRVGITDPADQAAYLDLLLTAATHTRDSVPVTIHDRIVLLSTCSADSTNGRDILIGKITDAVPANPFAVEKTNSPVAIPVIDELAGAWASAGTVIQAAIVALPCLLIAILAVVIFKRRRRAH